MSESADELRRNVDAPDDEADLLARIELEGGVDEEDLSAVLLVDAVEADHREEDRSYLVLSAECL